jgi:integrase
MGRSLNRLSAKTVESLKARGYYADGGGLYLQISSALTKSWVFRFTMNGRSREMGLGATHTVSLADARVKAADCRKSIQDGQDPIEARAATESAKSIENARAVTFKDCATAYVESHRAGWKNEKHAAQWSTTLETYAYPTIGKLKVADIDTGHVLSTLEPIWKEKTETASRLRGRIEAVLSWAKVRGYRTGENPARWKGHLDELLPPRAKVQKVKHHPALDYREVDAFMAALRGLDGMGARALEFAILTATRSGEVRGATWSEIDLDDSAWIIPAGRMKAEKEHRVPLSMRALALLRDLPRMDIDLIFPSAKNDRMSDMTMTAVIRRMHEAAAKDGAAGWTERGTGKIVTAHGFRSTFRDWAGETTSYPRDVIEHALAHQLKDKAEAAYARGSLFEKRRHLMEDWAAHCHVTVATGEVIPIQGRSRKAKAPPFGKA